MVNRVLRPNGLGRVLGLGLSAFLATSCGSKPPYEGKSVAQLEKMLQSADPSAQVQGAYGLSMLGLKARAAVPSLIEKLHSPNPLVRQNAAFALAKMGPEAAGAVPGLISLLSDTDWTVRRQAAMTLSAIGPPAREAVPALQKLESDLPLVRKAAAEARSKIGS
jgi:HEAT repeat protein